MSKEIQPNNYLKETIKLRDALEGGFIDLGRRLYEIKNQNIWQEGGYSSFEEFLMELKMSPATASKLTSIYDKYVIEYKIPQEDLTKVGWSSLYSMIPVVKDQESANEWVNKAKDMRRQDIEDEVKESKNGVCKHEDTEVIKLQICKDCNKRFRVYDES